jgi:hypothetical protein
LNPNFLKNISYNSILLYIIILAITSFLVIGNSLPFIWIIFGVSTIVLFFLYIYRFSHKWMGIPEKSFLEKLFFTALFVRIAWVVSSYFFYLKMTGVPFEFAAADSQGYHFEAVWISDLFRKGDIERIKLYYSTRVSDAGYPIYLTLIYSIFGKSILIARLIKTFIGAYTVVLICKLSKRNFGDEVGRLTGIFAMLYPNLVYYTGMHVKETEMVFILVLFVERADFLLRSKKLNYGLVSFVLLLNILLYFFRAVLAYSAFISFIVALIFSRKEIFHLKRKLSILLAILGIVLFLYGSAYFAEAMQYWEDRFSNQEVSLAHRTQTNSLAHYGSTIVFAPFALIAPFPTFVNIENQQNHMLLSGAFFVKNVLAFFVILSIILLITKKRWKNHVFLMAILISYVTILSMSKYAIVERFHLPALPFHIMFSVFGISLINEKHYRSFKYYLLFIALVIIGWNLFKLLGRGLL